MSKLIPVGQLKPLSWFRCASPWPCILLEHKAGVLTYAYRQRNTIRIGQAKTDDAFEPLPDCDSFDWQPPRESTALELARELVQCFERRAMRIEAGLVEEIVAAMEREAKR